MLSPTAVSVTTLNSTLGLMVVFALGLSAFAQEILFHGATDALLQLCV